MPVSRLGGIADTIILSSGWRRNLIAFAAGAVGVLALPPFGVFPLLVVPMCVALWLLDGASPHAKQAGGLRSAMRGMKQAFKLGWWMGFGYFLAGLWWLGAAFLVEADQFAWALPLGVMGLPAVLAIFFGIGFAVSRLLWSHRSARVLALAAGLGLAEWLRSIVLTGFPWNNLGMALGGNIVLAQSSSIVGLHGLTILAVALAASPALLADRERRRAPLALSAGLLVFVSGFGALRLATGEVGSQPEVRLRIMQPNLPQDDKFRPEAMPKILARYLELSGKPSNAPAGVGGVTHIVWPESPFPVVIGRDAVSLQQIGDFLAPQMTLITGAVRAEATGRSGGVQYFNSVQVIRPGGVVIDSYDKAHLVPFGEYLPFRRAFDALGLRQFVHVPGGFEAGASRRLINAPGLPAAAPLICYEAIFSGRVVPQGGRAEGASLLLNVTNDGWFGDTPGPRQHFAQARLRAIEEGLPLVRAANTGISAIVDPYGRILESLPVGVEGVVDGSLPSPGPKTFYARHPVLAPLGLWLLVLGGALGFSRIRRSRAG